MNTEPKPGRRWLIPVIAGALLLAVGLTLMLCSDLFRGLKAINILRDYLSQPEYSIALEARLEQNGTPIPLSGTLHKRILEEQEVLSLQWAGTTLSVSGGNLYLENGSVYGLGEYDGLGKALPADLPSLLTAVDIDTQKESDETLYHLTTKGELSPDLHNLSLTLQTRDDAITAMTLTMKAGELALTVHLTPMSPADSDFTIPEAAEAAILSGREPEQKDLPADLLRLITAFSIELGRDNRETRMALALDCGPLTLEEQILLTTARWEGLEVTRIERKDSALYFSDGRLYTESGNLVSENTGDGTVTADSADLLPSLAGLFLEGSFSCTESDGLYSYTMTLSQDAMKTITHALAPETESLPITFQDGSILLTLDEAGLRSMELSCGGSVQVLILDVPMSLSCKMNFGEPENPLELPPAVRDALTREGNP